MESDRGSPSEKEGVGDIIIVIRKTIATRLEMKWKMKWKMS